jgi:hypothetical protein
VNSVGTTLQSGISAMGLITTGFHLLPFLLFFLIRARFRLTAPVCTQTHTFGQDDDNREKKEYGMSNTQSQLTLKKRKVTLTTGYILSISLIKKKEKKSIWNNLSTILNGVCQELLIVTYLAFGQYV